MTFDDMIKLGEKLEKDRQAYLRGEYEERDEDKMSTECRQDWLRKCNS